MGALWTADDTMTAARRNREAIIGRLLMPMFDCDNLGAVKVNTKPLDGALLGTSIADLYTAPSTAGSIVQVHSLTLRNTSGSAVAGVTVYLVPNGGSAGVAETVFIDTIPANGSVIFEPKGGWFLGPSAKIKGLAGTASVITVRGELSEWASQPSGLVLKVVDGVALGTSYSTLYTAPAGVQHAIWLNTTYCNTAAASKTPVLALVESGDTASAEDEVFGDSVPAKVSALDDTPRLLEVGDFIRGKEAATGAVVGVRVTILEVAA